MSDFLPITSFTGKYGFLSNFYESPMEFNGVKCSTAEHLFQGMKAMIAGSSDHLIRSILEAKTPAKAKELGRNQVHLSAERRQHWETEKIDIMRSVLQTKFYMHGGLDEQLIDTYPRMLIEGNTWGDLFWGMNLTTFKGSNILGVLLMERRSELMYDYA